MRAELKRPYAAVRIPGGYSVGGSQMWLDNKVIRKCGCGAVAAYDLFRYLAEANDTCFSRAEQTKEDYCRELARIQHRYFPLFYPSGINGFLLAAGLNRLFRDYDLPFHARWAASRNKLFERIARMLSEDYPVILAVGPNFPFFWQKHGVNLYRREKNGLFRSAVRICGHYVTVLAVNEEWLRISSWGQIFEINLREYMDYVKKYSNHLFSNIVLIEKRGTD